MTPQMNTKPKRLMLEFAMTLLIGVILFVGLFTVTFHATAAESIVPDQYFHREIAENMVREGTLLTPHFIYHVFVIALQVLTQNWMFSAFLANLLSQAFLGCLIYVLLRLSLRRLGHERFHGLLGQVICAFFALALVILAPNFLLIDWVGLGTEQPLLLGFINPTVYHNPTTVVLRPLTLILYFFIVTYALNTPRSISLKQQLGLIVLGFILTVLCGLSKPNYILAMFPILGLWVVWSWFRGTRASLGIILLGVLLPSVLSLGWQFYFTYLNPTEQLAGGGIVFAPFEAVLGLAGGSRATMVLRFFVSLLFPLSILILYFQQVRRSKPMVFAWLTFGVGCALMYLLAESGDRMYHGNFFWSAYITNFILFFASVQFLLEYWVTRPTVVSPQRDWRLIVVMLFFGAHVVHGILYIPNVITFFKF